MRDTDTAFSDAEQALLHQAARQTQEQAAQTLLLLAKAYWRAGATGKFAETFRRAYIEKPLGDLARLSPDYPDVGPAEMRDMARALAAHGVLYAPVIGALAIAEAKLGNREAVRRLVDFDRFFRRGTAAVPQGTDAETFHDAVAAEIKSDLKFYDAPAKRSIRRGWRRNDVLQATTPALAALRRMLEAAVARYVAALPDEASHPFLAARPLRQRMDGWAVVSGADSHHVSHIHASAWITGVYYVTQPEASRGSRRGWLRVGPPAGVSAADGWDSQMVEPARGSFVLMPAYFFHETEAMGVDQERICIAFEAQHGELKHFAGLD